MIAPHLASSPHGLPILAPLAQYSTLGIKGERAANLLELGIHLHSETFISHAWNQAILDEQWCGRDARCGKVMLRRSPQSTWALLLQSARLIASACGQIAARSPARPHACEKPATSS